MAPTRTVTLVHRALDSSGSWDSASSLIGRSLKKLAFQTINHHAVEVYTAETATHYSSCIRFELLAEKDQYGYKKRRLNVVRNANITEFKDAKLYFRDVYGTTSLTDDELEEIAEGLIEEHGPYNLAINSCQKWAVLFFDEISNVHSSYRAKFEGYLRRIEGHFA